MCRPLGLSYARALFLAFHLSDIHGSSQGGYEAGTLVILES